MKKFPHLYTCSVCEGKVSVVDNGLGIEPTITRKCEHKTASVYANRKVTLRGIGGMSVANKITLSARQFFSLLLKRSV